MPQMDRVPTRIYACPECAYRTPQRWVLARHLRTQHHLLKSEAKFWAAESEYWLNPHYVRRDLAEEYQDEDED